MAARVMGGGGGRPSDRPADATWLLGLCAVLFAFSLILHQLWWDGFEGEVATGLAVPCGLAFLPEGSALVSERDSARISRIHAAGGAPIPVGEIADAAEPTPDREGGLLGLAVSPQFATDQTVFAYHSAAGRTGWCG